MIKKKESSNESETEISVCSNGVNGGSRRVFRRGGSSRVPVRDEFRTVRIPDNDRTWLALGAKYTVSKGGSIDFGYAHLFVKDASINQTNGADTVQGNYKNSVDIVSAQYTHTF